MNVKILRSNSNRYQLWLVAVALLALIGLIAAGSGVAGVSHATSTAVVKTRKISGLGVVLVNRKGRTLYVFMKDQRRRVTCKGACATFWPPLKWKGPGKPKAGGSAKTKLLGTDKNPSGGRVVTYNKWPLYTYSGDNGAGQHNGQGLNLEGGKWYVISPKGKVIKHSASSGGGTTTSGGGGWG
jgi:predicted lipoprotein with Yx(FWY)xxD motif